MREFSKISDVKSISKILYDFLDIFPHLCEKIESIEVYAKKLSENANFYIGVENGEVFGISVFYSNDKIGKKAYISLIGLKSTLQQKGFGTWLLQQSENKALQDGMNEMLLEVDCDNQAAILFYQKNNYVINGNTDRNSMYMYKKIR